MKLEWSRQASDDLDAAYEHIAREDPRAAARLESRVLAAIARLTLLPESGRPGRVAGTRELVIPSTPYLVVYYRHGSVVGILRIMHGRRLWPPSPGTP